MTECRQALSLLDAHEKCPTCGSKAYEHDVWRRVQARDAGLPLDDWELKNLPLIEALEEVNDTEEHRAIGEQIEGAMNVESPPVQYRIRAITDPFEISLHNLLDGAQGRVLSLREKWGAFASLHEIESVIREEVAEFSSEVFCEKKKRKRAKAELFDIICAAARAWAELDQGEPLSDLKASKKRRKALAK